MPADDIKPQQSTVHETTEDASSEPAARGRDAKSSRDSKQSRPDRYNRDDDITASNFERGAADKDIAYTVNQPGDDAPTQPGQPEIGGGPGASDATSGGG